MIAVSCLVLFVVSAQGPGPSVAEWPPAAVGTADGRPRFPAAPVVGGFCENLGQWDDRARFVWRRGGVLVGVERDGLRLVRQRTAKDEKTDVQRTEGVAVRMAFEGCSPDARPVGRRPQAGVSNFLIGNDPAKWRTDVESFAEVVYEGLYPGVDLRVREERGQLKYDVLLEAGTDLGQVRIRTEGIGRLEIREQLELVLEPSFGVIRQEVPVTWYEGSDGRRLPATCRFVAFDQSSFGFEVAPARSDLPLVIDPGLDWGTFLGGMSQDSCVAVGATSSGDVIIAGGTQSADFPTTAGGFSRNLQWADVFVTRLSADGSRIAYSTFIGGSDVDGPRDMKVAPNDDVILIGETSSGDYPITPGAFDPVPRGVRQGFVTRLDATGRSLVFSTFLGQNEIGMRDLALYPDGSTVVVGWTGSGTWPTTPGAYKRVHDLDEAFITRLNATGTGLIASTLLGAQGVGGSFDVATAVAVDATGAVTVVGHTKEVHGAFPTTPSAYDRTYNGGESDAFVTRFDPTLGKLLYSTLLGGASSDPPIAVAVSPTGSAVVVGGTGSKDFPTTPGVLGRTLRGSGNSFITRLDPTGSALQFSTFLTDGPSGGWIRWMDLDPGDAIYLVGGTSSSGFPTTPGARDRTFNGGIGYGDGFGMKIDPVGSRYLYSSLLGGSEDDSVEGATLLPSGSLLVVGWTRSRDFPVTAAGLQSQFNGGESDGFVVSESMLPTGVSRYGSSTPACGRPLTIGVTSIPQAGGKDFALTCAGGRPYTWGVLLLGGHQDVAGTALLGAMLHVGRRAPLESVLALTDGLGAAEIPIAVPAVQTEAPVFAQFVWPNDPACASRSLLSASNALAIVVQ